jgi:hypothetical protein
MKCDLRGRAYALHTDTPQPISLATLISRGPQRAAILYLFVAGAAVAFTKGQPAKA